MLRRKMTEDCSLGRWKEPAEHHVSVRCSKTVRRLIGSIDIFSNEPGDFIEHREVVFNLRAGDFFNVPALFASQFVVEQGVSVFDSA